jgi:hypothetical protein
MGNLPNASIFCGSSPGSISALYITFEITEDYRKLLGNMPGNSQSMSLCDISFEHG